MKYFQAFFLLFLYSKRSVNSASSSSVSSSHRLPVDDRIPTLKSYGQEYIASRKYKKASLYYSAILQLLEGVAGQEPDELRMKCSSILAFCNLKDGQYYEAIARCTEVIEQSSLSYPPKVHEIKSLSSNQQYLLGITYYRRGLSFNNIGLPNLAVIDWKIAHLLIPKNRKVLQQMQRVNASSESSIDSANQNITDTTISHPETSGAEFLESSATASEEDLANILDYSLQVSEPRHFTKFELESLLRSSKTESSFAATSPFGQLGNGGAGPLGAGLGALGGLGGLGGLGALGAGGKGGLRSQLAMLAPLAQQFLGVDRGTIDQVLDIGDALFDTFKLFARVFRFLAQYSGAIMALVWIASALLLKK